MSNVSIMDNGSCFMVTVDGLAVQGFQTLGDAWRHIEWMYRVASQRFTVGKNNTPIILWIHNMYKQGIFEGYDYTSDLI